MFVQVALNNDDSQSFLVHHFDRLIESHRSNWHQDLTMAIRGPSQFCQSLIATHHASNPSNQPDDNEQRAHAKLTDSARKHSDHPAT